ncbi:MAG: YccF domain-containing protein [Coprococcus sp.]
MCSYENIRKYSLVYIWRSVRWIRHGFFAGCIWCITIIGIPVGLQCFKFASLAFWPFGKEIVYENGMFSFLVNLIWILFFGWETAMGNLIIGFLWCITIVENSIWEVAWFKMAAWVFLLPCHLDASMTGEAISRMLDARKAERHR